MQIKTLIWEAFINNLEFICRITEWTPCGFRVESSSLLHCSTYLIWLVAITEGNLIFYWKDWLVLWQIQRKFFFFSFRNSLFPSTRFPFWCKFYRCLEEQLTTTLWWFLPIPWPGQWGLQTSLQWKAEHSSLQWGTAELSSCMPLDQFSPQFE